MTPEQIKQERAAFEAWHKEAFGYLPKKYKDGTFMSSSRADEVSPQDMFEGWLAHAEQTGWISVGDRLPKKCDFYLVWDDVEKSRFEACFIPEKQIFRYQGGNITDYVTHWQPLPQPPAGDAK